jgi:N-acyl-D-aspartate/D-glutamate deacylase
MLLALLGAFPVPRKVPTIPGGSEFDLVIKGGMVVDGTGSAPVRADVGVRNGRIVAVGTLGEFRSRRVVEAAGSVVAPGFIDLLCHNELLWYKDEQMRALRQGVTTGLVGNCGFSILFVKDNLDKLERSRPLLNLGTLLAHGSIRDRFVKSRRKTLASPAEMAAMKQFLEKGLSEGAFGLSSGLGYEPGEWTDPAELQDLASVLGRHPNSGYYTHLRNFRSQVLEAIREAITVARSSRVPVIIQHLLFKLPGNWDQAPEGLRLIRQARDEGLPVWATVYPYDFWGNEVQIELAQMLYLKPEMLRASYYSDESRFASVAAAIRKRLDEYGGADRIEITRLDPNMPQDYLGRTIGEIARMRDLPEGEAVLGILLENRRAVKVCYHGLSEKALEQQMRSPFVLIGSDATRDIPHPRNAGAFPRVFGVYVREKRTISLPEAVRKCTSEPARLMGLSDRGQVKEGYWADLVVFEPNVILDAATPVSPDLPPKGIRVVVVNGVVTVEKNRLTGVTPGKVLRRGER